MYASDLLEHEQRGNGIILIWEKRFVFAVGKEQYWDKTTTPWTITFTNIGGTVERGESMIEATKREVFEETGCKVELFPASQTLYCTLEARDITQYTLEDECPPILIYNTTKLPLWSVCVYLAQTTTVPAPQREVPALLFLPPSSLQGGPLKHLLQSGGIITEQESGMIPRSAFLQPWGSAKLLATDFELLNSIINFNKWLD